VTPGAFDAACRALPGVTMVVQWGADGVYKVGGRIFAVAGPEGVSFKATDIAFEALTESGRARPAPYMARARWVRFDDLAALDDAEMSNWLATAHALVAARLTRAQRRDIGLPEAARASAHATAGRSGPGS
jgi:predicted DNA-binding protein (MmcQ/YjbR family)